MSIPEMEQSPCLSVSHVSKRFGEGCEYCLSPDAKLERNICPHCHTVHAVRGNTARTDQADNQRVVQNRVESGDYTEIVASIDDDLNGQGRQ